MAKSALEELYDLMNDGVAGIANRVRAATAASRVEPLAMPGEDEPPAVVFLRSIVASQHKGLMFHYDHRTAAATALSYWERRRTKAELQYAVADDAERTNAWRRLINGGIRFHLTQHNRWPQDKHILLTDSDAFDVPNTDPSLVLSALMLGGNRQARRRLKRAIDEPVTGVWSGTEEERQALLKVLAQAMHQRLAEFKHAA
jgi:hypothetical protein